MPFESHAVAENDSEAGHYAYTFHAQASVQNQSIKKSLMSQQLRELAKKGFCRLFLERLKEEKVTHDYFLKHLSEYSKIRFLLRHIKLLCKFFLNLNPNITTVTKTLKNLLENKKILLTILRKHELKKIKLMGRIQAFPSK